MEYFCVFWYSVSFVFCWSSCFVLLLFWYPSLSLYLSIHQSMYISVSLIVCLYIYKFVILSVCLSLYLSVFCPSVPLCVCLYPFLPLYLSAYLSTYLFLCLSVYLFIFCGVEPGMHVLPSCHVFCTPWDFQEHKKRTTFLRLYGGLAGMNVAAFFCCNLFFTFSLNCLVCPFVCESWLYFFAQLQNIIQLLFFSCTQLSYFILSRLPSCRAHRLPSPLHQFHLPVSPFHLWIPQINEAQNSRSGDYFLGELKKL